MFSAPLSLTTDSHFELPSYLHESGVDNAWCAANVNGRDIHSYLVAPTFDAMGNLWVCDTPFGRIFRITPTGEWDLIIKYDGWPSGLAFHRDGHLYVADARHGILSLNIDLRKLSPVVTHHLSQRFMGVNDLCFAKNGDMYFTDPGQSGLHQPTGGVYRLKATGDTFGELQKLLSNVPGPTGLALSTDEDYLFISAAHDNAIWRAPLVEGGVSRVNKFIQLSGGVGPGGIVIDIDDNLFVAHLGLGTGWMFDKRGESKYRIDSCRGDSTTALTLDVNDPRVVIMTESITGTILKASLPMY